MAGLCIEALVGGRAARNKPTVGMRMIIEQAVQLALPSRCPGCGAVTGADHRFCAPCWTSLRFLGEPCCAGCGVPFEHDHGLGARCGECLAAPPRHVGARAAVAYGPVARAVALGLKYGGRAAYAETAARLMRRHVGAVDLLVPVPLHRGRLWSRGYNQAALIADALGRLTGVPTTPFALVRRRATPVLRGLSRSGRRRAVAAAFAIDPRHVEAVRGKRVLLIDDVYTSGATTDACVATLLRARAASVAILCWARVLDDAEVD